jgi:preprotein translocase subunit SecE
MSKKQKYSRQQKFGKQPFQQGKDLRNEKKSFLHPKHRSTIWTIIIVIILIVFFIINNTRETSAEGPYPPNYKPGKTNENTSP